MSSKNRLRSNVVYLALLHGANMALPLLTVPFLLRMLGVELFGLLALANAFVAYFVIITDYGFNLTATKDISIHSDDPQKVSEIFSVVITAKVLLLILSALIFLCLILTVDYFAENRLLYSATFLMVVGQVFFPTWLFQGLEKMGSIAYLNIFSKALSTFCIFVFIRSKDDVLLAPLITSIGFLLAACLSLLIVFLRLGVVFQVPTIQSLIKVYKEGWYVFLSQLKISLFSTSNVLILGLISGNLAVGYYSAAEKIMRAFALLQVPVTAAIYPRIARNLTENKVETMVVLKKLLFFGSVAYALLLGLVSIYSADLVYVLYKDGMEASVQVLNVMLLVPLLIFINNIFGTQIMLGLGMAKQFFWVLLVAAIISLFFCSLLSYVYGYMGAAFALLLTEIFIAAGMFFFARKEFFSPS